uniref:Uncharacterized protein n=1 Tax=Oryza meridionalis TaxID=40149 RepID=A0A0E0ETW9_9ORYZ
MDHLKRITGMAKGLSAVPARKNEDESLVLFGELYRHEKEKDVNLLEPMYSVEFEAIQVTSRMFKLPSGKKDYLLPDGGKHDYDWLKTPPATPLFPSLEMEANSSQMVFQRELPILQPVKTSRFSIKPEPTSTSTRTESPTSSSSRSATPTARSSSSSSKKNFTKGDPALSEVTTAYKMDKRSSYTPLKNIQQLAAPTTKSTAASKAAKKTSASKKPEFPGSTNAVNKTAKPGIPDKPLKKTTATAPKAQSKDPAIGMKDLKMDAGTARRIPCPPAATVGSNNELNKVAGKGRRRTGGEPAPGNGSRATEATTNGRRIAVAEKEHGQRLGSLAKNSVSESTDMDHDWLVDDLLIFFMFFSSIL